MKVRFYNFSKRRNSTKQPPSTGYTEKEVYLKESTSIKNPSFVLNSTDFSWNYAYIPDWNRYYFVDDIISITKDTNQYDLTEDVLATNKSEIGSTVARIAFSSTGYDINLVDSRIGVSTKKLNYKSTATASGISQTGCYVITVFNDTQSVSNGLGQSYCMDAANMQKIKEWLGDPSIFNQAANYFLGNPLESIFQCHWVPFPLGNIGSVVGVIYIGNQMSNALSAYTFSGTGIYGRTDTVSIPWRYNDFRDSEPYTSATLYLPGVGNIDLNMSDWLNSNNINIQYSYEYGTGDVTYLLVDDSGFIIQTASCNMASQCPLGQFSTNVGGMIQSVGGIAGGIGTMVAGALTNNPAAVVGGAAATVSSGASLTLSANHRASSIKGTVGGRTSALLNQFVLTGFYMDTEDVTNANYIARKGRPVCKTQAISNHSGYVQCDDASVSLGGESWERDEINAYLNGGFFYE